MKEIIVRYIVKFGVPVLMPLIPVIILYWFFGEQNYFNLDGFWKSVVCSGPIAAYAFLYWLTLKYPPLINKPLIDEKELQRIERAKSIELPDIKGKWVGSWEWEDPNTGKNIMEETIAIKQNGRYITGTIESTDGLNSSFQGSIFARMLTFYYVSKSNSRISCGSVTVKINPLTNLMEGYQIYHDLFSEELTQTNYKIKRFEE